MQQKQAPRLTSGPGGALHCVRGGYPVRSSRSAHNSAYASANTASTVLGANGCPHPRYARVWASSRDSVGSPDGARSRYTSYGSAVSAAGSGGCDVDEVGVVVSPVTVK